MIQIIDENIYVIDIQLVYRQYQDVINSVN